MMRPNYSYLFIIGCLLLTSNIFAQAPAWSWATGAESTSGSVSCASITSNDSGYSAICGSYGSQLTIGQTTLNAISPHESNFYLSFYAPGATAVWSTRVGGTVMNHGQITKVTFDNQLNVYVFGYYQDSIEFGDQTMNSPGYTSIFAVKYDRLGNRLWVKTLVKNVTPYDDNHQTSYTFASTSDNSNFLFIIAHLNDSADCDGTILRSSERNKLFSAAYNTNNGNLQQAGLLTGTGVCTASTFAADKKTGIGYVYFTGQNSSDHAFVSVLSSGGGPNITDSVSGGYSYGSSIAVSPSGIVYVGGSFADSLGLSTSVLKTSSSYFDGFLGAFEGNLQLKWLTSFGGDRVDQCFDVCSDVQGNAYVTGFFELSANFGNYTLTNPGNLNNISYLAKYDSLGNAQWAIRPESGSNSSNLGVGVAASNMNGKTELFLGGVYADTIHFGSVKIGPITGGVGYYLAAMDPTIKALVSTDKNTAKTISIYPNPSKHLVTINFTTTTSENSQLLITDALGRIVYHSNNVYSGGHHGIQLNVSSFSAGVYNCIVKNSDGKASTSSLVIE